MAESYDPMQVEEGEVEIDRIPTTQAHKPPQRGRKRVRNPEGWTRKHVKRKGLRQNTPQVTIDAILVKECCNKKCVQHLSAEYLTTLRQHFGTLTYEEQNLYLTGLVVRKETKKSVGHRRKSNPTVGKNGKKLGRPPAEESSFSVEYQIRNEKGLIRRFTKMHFS